MDFAKLNHVILTLVYNRSRIEIIHSERKIVSILSSRRPDNYHALRKETNSGYTYTL